MIIIIVIFALNIVWAVLNWKNEFDLIKAAGQERDIPTLILAVAFFVADIGITGTATSLFGFAGFYGSAMAIFMSNILSVVFFVPKGNSKDMLKRYRHRKR